MSIKSKIRTVENYPIEGIMFRDITTLFTDPDGLREAINLFLERYKDIKIDKIVAIESRGFFDWSSSSVSSKYWPSVD